MVDEDLKNKIDETGSKIDDKVEETSAKYNVPKWIVWLGGVMVVGAVLKILF